MPRVPVSINASAEAMANEIFGDGVQVESATYVGANGSSGIFRNGDSVSPDATPSDRGVILSTGNARDFSNRNGGFNQSSGTSANTSGEDNNPEFNAIAGTNTFDASYLTVEFIPTGDTMTMQFVFASEEYPEFTNSVYQDFVSVNINGNEVPLTVGNGEVDPNNINDGQNESLFVDNTGGAYNTEMDGFTLTMTLTIPVNDGVLNIIRFAIADVSDSSYDSSLLIASGSVQTTLIANTDTVNIAPDGEQTVDLLANDTGTGSLTITHINGQPAVVGVPIVLANGQSITLNADGTVFIEADGDEETVNFTYTIADGSGNTDVGFVTLNQAPCFVSGTLMRTPNGEVPIEYLEPGDLVETLDNGPQPIRWSGQRRVRAEGKLAPIRITDGAFGDHRSLLLSPLHRVLINNAWAQLLFGQDEVLMAARDLVNDHSVIREPGGWVTYHHILFDTHQIVFSENLTTESFLPGPQTAEAFEAEIVEEICSIFPELDPHTGCGYGRMARMGVKSFEATAYSALAAA
ncbi:Hint domain-containing protein [Shimia abyssi]|uniref:Hint domain-containing protein n=1 Tax=Shimia abyssi TaxID=1662395 RepID=A0A2P8F4C5_9RHOB|nr:Hint domain-containing protein [Shimia abyssi]PSL16564.1 Hint domain-containing protein [Shimia abyssi]